VKCDFPEMRDELMDSIHSGFRLQIHAFEESRLLFMSSSNSKGHNHLRKMVCIGDNRAAGSDSWAALRLILAVSTLFQIVQNAFFDPQDLI